MPCNRHYLSLFLGMFLTRRVVLIKFKGLLVALMLIAPLATSNGTPNGRGCSNGWHDGFLAAINLTVKLVGSHG